MSVTDTDVALSLVAWCRGQIGVPWVHQGRKPGVALDCIGLQVCCARAHGLVVLDDLTYSERPVPSQLIESVMENCVRVNGIAPGRLVLFRMGRIDSGPTHSGTLTGDDTFVHVRRGHGDGKVSETKLTEGWLERIHSIWEYRWKP